MNNELTNVYAIIKKEFKDVLEYFGLANSKELAAFLHYNARNEMFVGTDDNYYHNVYFKNLDTGKESRMFKEGYLYFFPKGNDTIEPNNRMTAFSIEKNTKCIRINENGLFVEKNDLQGNILTEYYDCNALEEIAKDSLSAGSIDYVENYIERLSIQPDRVFITRKNGDSLVLSTFENGEEIIHEEVPIDKNRTLYSIYYEYMKANNYYGDIIQRGKGK